MWSAVRVLRHVIIQKSMRSSLLSADQKKASSRNAIHNVMFMHYVMRIVLTCPASVFDYVMRIVLTFSATVAERTCQFRVLTKQICTIRPERTNDTCHIKTAPVKLNGTMSKARAFTLASLSPHMHSYDWWTVDMWATLKFNVTTRMLCYSN